MKPTAIARKIASAATIRGRESKKPPASVPVNTTTRMEPPSGSAPAAARSVSPSTSTSAELPALGSSTPSAPGAPATKPRSLTSAAFSPVSSLTSRTYASGSVTDPESA